MKQVESNQGIDVNTITFDEHGEMIVLDNELLELISGGAGKPVPRPGPGPNPPIGSGNNGVCNINFSCSPPTPAPKPQPNDFLLGM